MKLVKQVTRQFNNGTGLVTVIDNYYEDETLPKAVAAERNNYNRESWVVALLLFPFRVMFYTLLIWVSPFAGVYLMSRDRGFGFWGMLMGTVCLVLGAIIALMIIITVGQGIGR